MNVINATSQMTEERNRTVIIKTWSNALEYCFTETNNSSGGWGWSGKEISENCEFIHSVFNRDVKTQMQCIYLCNVKSKLIVYMSFYVFIQPNKLRR